MIFKHHSCETKRVTIAEIPERYRYLIIPNSTIYFTKGLFGVVLTQMIHENGFAVWQHHFFIDQPCTLVANNQEPAVVINYMLRGNPYAKLPGVHETVLDENKYRLFYVPPVSHPVSFIEGEFNCVHIDYEPAHLAIHVKNNQRLADLLSYVVKDGTQLLSHLSGTITEQIKANLIDILWYNAIDRVPYIQRLASRLLLQYVFGHYAIKGNKSEVEQYIERRLNERLTIEELMKFSCKSERAFFRDFKVQFNITPKEFIQKKRVDKAKQYLRSTMMSIAEIAVLVGFESPRGFQKAFKKHVQMTAEEFRRMQ